MALSPSPTLFGDSSSATASGTVHFVPKLSIKLDEKNFLLWNQQVEGVIISHKLHRFVVNPQIPPMYNSESDRELDIVSEAYDQWLVQDQMLFTWLLSTLAESVLPHTITCRHAFQVWEQIHKHFHAHLKAKVRQLRYELKTIKKGTKPMNEFVLRVRAIADTLLSIGDSVTEQDQIDAILDGLPEEYNPFVMMIYGRPDSPSLLDIEGLLLVQESQLEKFRQELAISNASANVAHANGGRGNTGSRGRGRNARGKGRGQGNNSGNRHTCQLCHKYGHEVVNCWYRFDENFTPVIPTSAPKHDPPEPKDKDPNPQACTASVASSSTQELVIPQSWFPDSGASHHLTANFENLAQGKSYLGSSKVHIGNGVGLNISSVGHASFQSKLALNHNLYLNQLLHVPSITKNLLSVSKFAADNNVYFEFHAAHCFVKSQVNNQVLLKGSLGADGLYCFPHLPLTKGPTCLTSVAQSSTSSLTNKDKIVQSSAIESVTPTTFNKVPCNFSEHSNSSAFTCKNANLWHQRLGHANSKVVHNVLHLCNIVLNNKNSVDFCDSYCVGKSHKLHAPLTDTVYHKPFELVHTNL
ncbi:hypothetical protein P8452_70836 [Trifolium repens]|nr:hypothetical protein P8452_70836 [Trifolium repens]